MQSKTIRLSSFLFDLIKATKINTYTHFAISTIFP